MKVMYKYFILGALLIMLPSCIFDDGEPMIGQQDPMMITFTLDVQSPTPTKGDDHTWGDNDDDIDDNDYPEIIGDSFENRIDVSDLMIAAYRSDGTFIRELPIISITEDSDGIRFLCAFEDDFFKDAVPEAPPVCKFMVLANCIDGNYSLSYNGNIPNMDGLMFSASSLTRIPMWGIKAHTFTFDGDKISKTQEIGSIPVLRALSKVGVKLSDELKAEGFRIRTGSLKLNYARASGYCVPSQWAYVSSTSTLKHDQAFRPSTVGALNTDINALGWSGDETGYYIYVPETENGDASYQGDPNELSISITLEKEDGDQIITKDFPYEKGILFRNYDYSGRPTEESFNIVRNHFYDFTIAALEKTELVLEVRVEEWEFGGKVHIVM